MERRSLAVMLVALLLVALLPGAVAARDPGQVDRPLPRSVEELKLDASVSRPELASKVHTDLESAKGPQRMLIRLDLAPSASVASKGRAAEKAQVKRVESQQKTLIASLKRLNCLDRVCVGGFSDQRLRRLRREFGGRLCSSFGPVQMASLRTGARVPFGGQLAQVPVRFGRLEIVTPGTVSRAHRRGYHVHVWTIDDPDEMTRLLDLGIDGIMTDRPQVLKDVLVARGEWR